MPSTPPHKLVDDWLAYLERRGLSHHTVASYTRALHHFARWSQQTYNEAFEPARIIARDVRDWKAHQQTVEGAKPATINQRLVALSRFFKWAKEGGHVETVPTAEVKGLRTKRRQPKALDRAATRRLLRAVHAHGGVRDVAMVELLLGAGLRVEELLNLKRGDVELGERSGQVTVRKGKRESWREVPLTAPVRRALAAYLETEPQLEGEDPLWVGQRGPLHDPSGVWRMMKKYARLADVDVKLVSPHVMRHTFATRYLQANPGDIRNLASILGHKNIETTMIYTEPTTEDLAKRMERMERGAIDYEQENER